MIFVRLARCHLVYANFTENSALCVLTSVDCVGLEGTPFNSHGPKEESVGISSITHGNCERNHDCMTHGRGSAKETSRLLSRRN